MWHLTKVFCKTIYSVSKNGIQKYEKTNHYIFLTNVSIKRLLKLVQMYFFGGVEEFQPDKYLTDIH